MIMQTRDVALKRNERRQFLKLAGYGALGWITSGFRPVFGAPAFGQNKKTVLGSDFLPDLDISLAARPDEVAVFPGSPTRVWRYHAIIHKGDKGRVLEIPESYLGPIINVHRGEKIRIRFNNSIPEASIIHWHGLHVPAIMDGHPRHVISQGQSYLYEFEVKNRAGTYWYHPHPHGRTGPQVYRGLAGLFLVSDDEEQAAGLPDGEYDVPLVIQDRTFDLDNQLVYTSGRRMDQMTGFLGDRIMVNGLPDFTLPVSTGAYRLRVLNGSNSRIYKLAWKDGRPLTVVGTDGGLLERPANRRYAFLSPGERLEIWADFSDRPVGYETSLISLPFNTGGMGGGRRGRGMMMGGRTGRNQRLPNGAGFPIFNINVTKPVKNHLTLPDKLSDIESIQQDEAVNFFRPRQFFLTMRHMQWSINGREFQMEEVADDEIVELGSKEIWEFHNTGSGMMHMMNMPHPIHLHGKQFRVLERSGVMHESYVDEGWKDTVLIMPGERIRILVEFDDYPGMFLYHCHNLEHEDMGMMRNYFVRET
ncbi:Multicopper oxidase [Olavius algarvensis associated proteobacterium Delta 3]|nr:Multicopper oxidase [Olavius algarvensis associated proteobacterium Delta 3]CAB5149661.1 Multicopper oxidase [Olavius algarvensis associated proteobacterium Delta 3]